ncbi:MAG: ACP S-malonyltransferase [Smithellaceae bacterium]|nr:ACP S-malonyltransferase [Smithellaceae bacterium]
MTNENIAVVFPGQGSQRPGMGKDFYEEMPVCRETYQEASDVLGWDVAAMCFGDDERLNQTEYTQPCIVTTEVAMLRGLAERYGFLPGIYGGHSLGEYTALVAAGVIPLSVALYIVGARGRLMQEAMPLGTGAMSAVISPGVEATAIERLICDLPIDVANVNSRDQVVISGHAEGMPAAESRIIEAMEKEKRECRIVSLNVSAAFHSRFMAPIQVPLAEVLSEYRDFISAKSACRVTSNYTGTFHVPSEDRLCESLISQVTGTVRWKENVETLAKTAREVFEIGPSRPLKSLLNSMGVECRAINTLGMADRIFGMN